jgi:4-amino-4-deoxy-L-arabinose transferase-like glycosyltransferase
LPIFWRLGDEEFHGDESHWTTSGQQAFYLLASGRVFDPQWRDEFYLYSQPQVGKLLIGASLAAAGHRGPARIYDYDWEITPAQNRQAGRVPPPDAVLVARLPGAIAGWLACLLLWRLAAGLGAPRAGVFAALLLASHPLWLANARRAGMDTVALGLGLAGVWAVMKAAGGRDRALVTWFVLAGLCFGLGAGTKYVAALAVPAAVAVSVLALRRNARAVLVGGAAALAVALGVFYGANPTFYERPLPQFKVTLDFLSIQAEGMRQTMPLFRSPPLVAAEIVDRAIWPTRFPPVRDLSLPEPLVPGSYGTPIVALGAAIALVFGAAHWHRADNGYQRALGVAVCWAAVVFALLALSVPTWWERWHLPLIPPLCLLAGVGLQLLGGAITRAPPRVPGVLARLARAAPWLLVGSQYLGALAVEPSFLGKGFGALVLTPVGAAAHLGALAATLIILIDQWRNAAARLRRSAR